MSVADVERLVNELGSLLAEDKSYPLDGTFLYAEVDDTHVRPSIYKALPTQALYRRPDLDRLGNCLLDLWYAFPEGRKFAAISYIVRGETFDLQFVYPDELDPKEWPEDRRERILKAHFGDKPIVYPPWEDDDDDFEL